MEGPDFELSAIGRSSWGWFIQLKHTSEMEMEIPLLRRARAGRGSVSFPVEIPRIYLRTENTPYQNNHRRWRKEEIQTHFHIMKLMILKMQWTTAFIHDNVPIHSLIPFSIIATTFPRFHFSGSVLHTNSQFFEINRGINNRTAAISSIWQKTTEAIYIKSTSFTVLSKACL